MNVCAKICHTHTHPHTHTYVRAHGHTHSWRPTPILLTPDKCPVECCLRRCHISAMNGLHEVCSAKIALCSSVLHAFKWITTVPFTGSDQGSLKVNRHMFIGSSRQIGLRRQSYNGNGEDGVTPVLLSPCLRSWDDVFFLSFLLVSCHSQT